MASEWIVCTLPDGKTLVRINAAVAATIVPHKKGTRIAFPGSAEDLIDVQETPERIGELIAEAKNANRT